jgi:hypothetical protein
MTRIGPIAPAPIAEADCGTRECAYTLIGALAGLGASLAACWSSTLNLKALVVVSSTVGGAIFGYALGCSSRPSRPPAPRPVDPPQPPHEPVPPTVEVIVDPPQQPPEPIASAVVEQPAVQRPTPQIRPEVDPIIRSYILSALCDSFAIAIEAWNTRSELNHNDPRYRELLECLSRIQQSRHTFADQDRVFELLAGLDLDDQRIRPFRELLFSGVVPQEYQGEHPRNQSLIEGLMDIAVNRNEAYRQDPQTETQRNAVRLLDVLVNPSTRHLYYGIQEEDVDYVNTRIDLLDVTPIRENPLPLRPELGQEMIQLLFRDLLLAWLRYWEQQSRQDHQHNEPYVEMIAQMRGLVLWGESNNPPPGEMEQRCQTCSAAIAQLIPGEQDHALALLQEICCEGTTARDYPPEVLKIGTDFLHSLRMFSSRNEVTSLLQGMQSPGLRTYAQDVLESIERERELRAARHARQR